MYIWIHMNEITRRIYNGVLLEGAWWHARSSDALATIIVAPLAIFVPRNIYGIAKIKQKQLCANVSTKQAFMAMQNPKRKIVRPLEYVWGCETPQEIF